MNSATSSGMFPVSESCGQFLSRHFAGFHEITRDQHTALFSSGRTHHELLLIEIGKPPEPKTEIRPGLYHIGFRVSLGRRQIQSAPSVGNIAKTQRNCYRHRRPFTPSLTVFTSLIQTAMNLQLYADVTDEWRNNPNIVASPIKPLHDNACDIPHTNFFHIQHW